MRHINQVRRNRWNFKDRFNLTRYIQNINLTCTFFVRINLGIPVCLCPHATPQFGPATFQVPWSHVWMVTAVLAQL